MMIGENKLKNYILIEDEIHKLELQELEPKNKNNLEENNIFNQKRLNDLKMIENRIQKIIEYKQEIFENNNFTCELDFSLILPVYDWCSKIPFKDIVNKYNIPEGYIVRIILRLDESCRELENILKDFDNNLLENIIKGRELLKRSIIFEPGLYLKMLESN